ncbi:hypothetical protein QUE06_11400 [Lactococcus lactis]|uniref:hypothetical protein n=1 Tax=Lactococcus lactis TaxID=1358 RepID=UPI0025A09B1E|nr:hypothetical protein [Lactococcus lactis]MDM7535539.1 hypothetical protein [Lactococcus lactis]
MKICFAELSGIRKTNDVDFTDTMSEFYKKGYADKLLLASNRSKDIIKKRIEDNPFLIEQIGINRMNHLKQGTYFILSTKSEEFEKAQVLKNTFKNFSDAKKILDVYYDSFGLLVRNMTILFSTGMWLVKDSNIQPKYIYLCTDVNNYIGVYDIKVDYSNSKGQNSQVDITNDDIELCKKMVKLLYKPLLNIYHSENKAPSTIYINESRYFEVNRHLSTVNPSFTKALMLIQEARNTSFLASKVDKYIAALQCVFAVKDNFTFNCSRITSAYLGRNKKEDSEIIKFITIGYHIRSQLSHGKQVDEKKYDIEKTSNRLDSYMRRIMKKILSNDKLNYFTSEDEIRVRKYFKDMAKEKFEADYNNLKRNNRVQLIQNNIEAIKDLDTLMDIEEILSKQINKVN